MSTVVDLIAVLYYIVRVYIESKFHTFLQYREKDYRGAERRYFKGVRLLEDSPLADEAEELRQLRLLLKIRLNRSQCLIKMCWPKKACIELAKALEMDPKNAKALFRMGRAKKMIGNYNYTIECICKTGTLYSEIFYTITFCRKSPRCQKVPDARPERGPQRSRHQARVDGLGQGDT